MHVLVATSRRELGLIAVDDDVVVGLLAEVHLRAVGLERPLQRDVTDEELRPTIRLRFVHGGDGVAVAVGELQPAVHPRLRLDRELVGVEFAGAEQHLPLLAVDVVAVDIDIEEVEERADCLDLAEGGAHRRRIPEADVVNGVLVVGDLLLGDLLARRELPLLDAIEAVGVARRLNVAGDVRLLSGDFVRLDDEVLDDRRVDGAGD